MFSFNDRPTLAFRAASLAASALLVLLVATPLLALGARIVV